MEKKKLFRGAATALVTPFHDGGLDLAAYEKLIGSQIAGGVDALVVAGTTGEASTLTEKERETLFAASAAYNAGRLPLIYGAGSNDTATAVRHAREAKRQGADGILVVTPYYNKGTEEGIYRHYMAVAEASEVPVLLYNVPSRTGVNLSLATVEKLAAHENIVGIKEACDSAERLTALACLGDAMPLYAGNDAVYHSVLALGGAGAISVTPNVLPREFAEIGHAFFAGRYADSLAMQKRLYPLTRALFLETNPAPIKCLLAHLGICADELRLPLASAQSATRVALIEAYNALIHC